MENINWELINQEWAYIDNITGFCYIAMLMLIGCMVFCICSNIKYSRIIATTIGIFGMFMIVNVMSLQLSHINTYKDTVAMYLTDSEFVEVLNKYSTYDSVNSKDVIWLSKNISNRKEFLGSIHEQLAERKEKVGITPQNKGLEVYIEKFGKLKI